MATHVCDLFPPLPLQPPLPNDINRMVFESKATPASPRPASPDTRAQLDPVHEKSPVGPRIVAVPRLPSDYIITLGRSTPDSCPLHSVAPQDQGDCVEPSPVIP